MSVQGKADALEVEDTVELFLQVTCRAWSIAELAWVFLVSCCRYKCTVPGSYRASIEGEVVLLWVHGRSPNWE